MLLTMTAIIVTLSSVSVFDMTTAAAESHNNYDEVAEKIQSDPRFEKFPSHVLDAIRAGEIDEYNTRLIISKAPQDMGTYGSHTNVAKMVEIMENEMELEILGSGGADITLLAPVDVLPELAKYSQIERIIGRDMGIKYSNEDKTQGVIKYSYDERIYDISYNVTNARITHFTNFGVGFASEDDGMLQITYPIELTDAIRNIYDNSNATLTSMIADAGDMYDGYQVLELNDEHISIQWDFIHNNYPSNSLRFYGSVMVSGSEPITEDSQKDSSYKLPEWIKKKAGWWADDQIDDDSFKMGIEFLVENNIIEIYSMQDNTKSNLDKDKTIPGWIKNNAGWWADGKLTDDEFILGIEYLVENRIISI